MTTNEVEIRSAFLFSVNFTDRQEKKLIEEMLNRVHHSDCLEGLRRFPDESIDVIVTSPPYWKGFEYEAYFNSYQQYLDWCEKWLKECKRVLRSNGTFYLNVINDSEIQSVPLN